MEEVQELRTGKTSAALPISFLQEGAAPFLSAAFKKRLPPALLIQLLRLSEAYQAILRSASILPEKKLALQILYWQELYFSWQGLQLAETAESAEVKTWQQNPLLIWVNDYYLIQLRHLEDLLLLASDLEETKQALRACLKASANACSLTGSQAGSETTWLLLVENQSAKVLQALSAL